MDLSPGECCLFADCQYKVFQTANSMSHASRGLEESGKAPELRKTKEQIQRGGHCLTYLRVDCQYKVFRIANGIAYTSQGREESAEAPELRTTKEQNQIGGHSLTSKADCAPWTMIPNGFEHSCVIGRIVMRLECLQHFATSWWMWDQYQQF